MFELQVTALLAFVTLFGASFWLAVVKLLVAQTSVAFDLAFLSSMCVVISALLSLMYVAGCDD